VIEVTRILCRIQTPVARFNGFEPERSLGAVCRLPLQNVLEEVFDGTLMHVPCVSPFEPRWEIFRIDKYGRLITNC